MIFISIDPPDQIKCSPIMSGSIPFYWSFRNLDYVLAEQTISSLVTAFCDPLQHISQRILSSVPPLIRMWSNLCVRDVTGPLVPVDYWYNAFSMHPFFWLELFSVAESASSSFSIDSCLRRIFPLFQRPTSQTMNGWVLVAQKNFPFIFTFRGFVYSPLCSK